MSFNEITKHTHLSIDKNHLNTSELPMKYMKLSLAYALANACFQFMVFGASASVSSMLVLLGVGALTLRGILNRFKHAQDELGAVAVAGSAAVSSGSGLFGSSGRKQGVVESEKLRLA